MGTFLKAKRHHQVVSAAATENPNVAAELWNAIVGAGTDPVGTFAEAVRDTAPVEHGALLVSDDVAAACAFGIFWKDKPRTTAPPFELRDLARGLWARFDEQAQRTVRLAEGFGWDLGAAWTQAREVEHATDDLAQVERIARLAGRMHASLRGARARRVRGMPEEVYSVEQGNDVSRLLPSEQVLLTDPTLELAVLERVATRRAAQYAVRGTATRSRGPLVLALDESGSMHGPRNDWAKAAALTLARVALEDKRPVAVVHYSTSAKARLLRPEDANAMVTMVRHWLGGGTAIGIALRVAVEQVRELARRGQQGSDVVLVTDGVDGDEASQVAALDEASALGTRLWTVAIEREVSEGSPLRTRAVSYSRLGGPELRDGRSIALFSKL